MKITIEPTTKIINIAAPGGDIKARIWEGHTDKGTPVHCFIPRIAPSIEQPLPSDVEQEFASRLREASAPSPAVKAYDLRYFID